MRVHVLVSGLLRTFTTQLLPFLEEVNKIQPLEIYICTTQEKHDTKFTSQNDESVFYTLLNHPLCSSFVCNSSKIPESNLQHLTQREKNTFFQWWHINMCFQRITHATDEDLVIRIRPDVKFHCTPQEFVSVLQTTPQDGICIPTGNDLFHPSYRSYVQNSVNDQVAFGFWQSMKTYCTLYSNTDFSALPQPLISEAILWDHLTKHNVQIHRMDLSYSLCLADCKFVAITGDSGVGKTTLVKALQAVFPYDSNLVLETDRYHKWERNHQSWQTITHLNPDANFLEKMQDDTFRLKLGEHITTVDYDHATGTFTPPQTIESKDFVFLCGLHTLYKEEIRAHSNVKIYVDTARPLKRLWKIQRDMKKRGYTFERCAEIFSKREADFERYIAPQKQHADIVVHYYTEEHIPEVFTVDHPEPPLRMVLETTGEITALVSSVLEKYSEEVHAKTQHTRWYIKQNLSVETLLQQVPTTHIQYIKNIQPSYLGVLQIVLILVLMQPS